MHIKIKFIYLVFCITLPVMGQTLRVSLFNELPVSGVVVSSLKGHYKVVCDSSYSVDLNDQDAIYITLFNNQLLFRNAQSSVGKFSNIRFEAVDTNSVLRINLVSPNKDTRQFCDNLVLSVAFERISLINEVQLDNYIAGVVDAEAGPNADMEFYKAQAILVRTFLYANINKHGLEGFHLCDGVHCQAYHGRAIRNPIIIKATEATSGLVIVGQDSLLITAAFHANCGGETESAARAWLSNKSCLVPVKDPFCQNSSSARWTKTIPLDQWKTYLKNHGFKIPAGIPPGEFDFTQIGRKQFYPVRKDSMPVKQIRNDFKLMSTFFSVVATSKEITFKGRGFGHGVGLCQDGAMHMARIGYKCDDILKYYFKGVRIVDYEKWVSLILEQKK